MQKQIAQVKSRLTKDLALINNLKQYQLAEYNAICKTTANFYDKQHQSVQKLFEEAFAQEKIEAVRQSLGI